MLLNETTLEEMTKKWRDCAEKEWNHGKNRLVWVTELDQAFANWITNLSFQQIKESEGQETHFYKFRMKDSKGENHWFSCFYNVPDESYLLPRNLTFSDAETTFFFETFNRFDVFNLFQEMRDEDMD